MKIAYFTHSLLSCWNHGNAHFLRGVLRELMLLGHEVRVYEPDHSWSLENLLRDHGAAGLEPFATAYPELQPRMYDAEACADEGLMAELIGDAKLVLVHEWNNPAIVRTIGRLRQSTRRYSLLFHDTHHRAVSDPKAITAFDLSGYDGVLAFGQTLAEVYRRWGWGERAFVWHEAADTRLFHPPAEEGQREGLVWVGNWGDGERTLEIEEFLLAPARAAGLDLTIHGVRYPASALALLARYGARYRGWLANASAPAAFAAALATVHVPRRYYTEILPGIPTIRVFEALACGIPLASAPWEDAEQLFTPGADYLLARSGAEMAQHLKALKHDAGLRAALRTAGLANIRARHTCAHRAQELLAIHARLASLPVETAA